ncbi:toll-like receptor 9 [Dinothrombium tinctorium]|uniref:Toll-like receptor 9 n=1 Tax=Dinothrombium tinctorium TaxID=1965070 RepID=A0A443RKR1_9ACAR|nr:toll-like receptor 9 [Dinothrombium tinctorium]
MTLIAPLTCAFTALCLTGQLCPNEYSCPNHCSCFCDENENIVVCKNEIPRIIHEKYRTFALQDIKTPKRLLRYSLLDMENFVADNINFDSTLSGQKFQINSNYLTIVNSTLKAIFGFIEFKTENIYGVYVKGYCRLCEKLSRNIIDQLASKKTRSISFIEVGMKTVDDYTFASLSSLESLVLRRNSISQFSPCWFGCESVTKLKYLDLSYNKISIFKIDYFTYFPSLARLKLNGNGLRTVSWSNASAPIFRQLQEFSIASMTFEYF